MAAQPEIRDGVDAEGGTVVDVEARRTRGSHSCGRTIPRREWLTIHEASELIGVSPATLRRWSDAGEIKAFTTPGGHRRFARGAVLGLIPADRRERFGGRLGDIGERVVRVYRRLNGSVGSAWLDRCDEMAVTPFRELASTTAVALFDLLEMRAGARDAALSHAESSAAAFGALAAARGATIAEAVEAFLALRRPFLRELSGGACRQGFDARQTADLLDAATEAIDLLLGALVRGHQAGIEPRPVPAVTVVVGSTAV
ncbi:MAG TPA: helix-turn-helix domain-containing protein [Candidatus Limnocylindrales bacterium]